MKLSDDYKRQLQTLATSYGMTPEYLLATIVEQYLERPKYKVSKDVKTAFFNSFKAEKHTKPIMIGKSILQFKEAYLIWLFVENFHPEVKCNSFHDFYRWLDELNYKYCYTETYRTYERLRTNGYFRQSRPTSTGLIFSYTDKAIKLVNNMQEYKELINAFEIHSKLGTGEEGCS